MFKAIKETVSDVKQLVSSCQQLGTNIKELQDSLPAVNEFQDAVQRDIAKWQFKDQPRIAKIKEISARLNKQKPE